VAKRTEGRRREVHDELLEADVAVTVGVHLLEQATEEVLV